jgi:membrane protease YdiL (CAAX protease family)
VALALKWPVAGVLVAILITSTMDATGLSTFSALPLLPLTGVLWFFERHSRKSVGLAWGRWSHYALAVLYPLLVIGAVVLVSVAAGAADLAHTQWQKAGTRVGLVALTTILGALLTEEGFFRGWLWASLERAGVGRAKVVLATSAAFALWHWSAIILHTGFDVPAAQVPVFMVNAAVMGVVWGLLRAASGSVLVSSLSHGIWNGLAYGLFSFGTKVGPLGVVHTAVFGPEVGVVGLALNALFAAGLWRWWRARAQPRSSAEMRSS